MLKKLLAILTLGLMLTISLFFSSFSYAQKEETLEGKVDQILEEKTVMMPSGKQLYQKIECLITKGSLKGKTIIIKNGNLAMAKVLKYQKGDKVIISFDQDKEGNKVYFITDYVRRGSLFWLFIIFIGVTLLVSQKRGLNSLLGMSFSFLMIIKFILPSILAGASPLLMTLAGALFIIPVTFYLSHGLNKKTTVAIIGTLIALVITIILAQLFIKSAKLTGFAAEETSFLQTIKKGTINIKGLLLAGIIIGVLGVLDDITISQSAIVFQLKVANKKISSADLYKRAMVVGKDHIASMINTLILVYSGAALPLLLLFINNPHPFNEVINYEIIAEEIIRTLVGSIGLVLAVPITTFIASFSISRAKP